MLFSFICFCNINLISTKTLITKQMIQKKLTRLVGLKKDDFDNFLSTGQIQVSPARLIPALKTGDEMALTSIFLSALKLVKEFRDLIFKDLKLSRGGKVYYYTEACFKDISDSRICLLYTSDAADE